jgi:hypothetical protein
MTLESGWTDAIAPSREGKSFSAWDFLLASVNKMKSHESVDKIKGKL